jgi:hypothetical protein
MCNKEHLVGYLYSELSPADRAAFETHLAGCGECRQELQALGLTRQHLETWAPPEPQFNFTVVQSNRIAPPPAPRLAFVPHWGLAAAAALFMVAGAAAVANIEVRHGTDGSLVVRTGWSAPPADREGISTPAAAGASGDGQAGREAAASEQLKAQVATLERRLQELEEERAAQPVTTAAAGRPGISAPELRKILAESEARHQTELAVRIAQVWNDFNAARASDFARVQQTLGQVQGLTNIQLRQQRDSIDSLRYLHSISLQK